MYMYNQHVYNKLNKMTNIVNSSKQCDCREFVLTALQVCRTRDIFYLGSIPYNYFIKNMSFTKQ